MTEDEAKPYVKPIPNWYPETRTVIVCWMMFSSWIIILAMMAWGTPKGEGGQLLSTLLGMYIGTGLLTSITWWMGDAKGSDSTNKMQDEMSKAASANAGVANGKPKTAWWNKLTKDERDAIAASTVPAVVAFVAAPVTNEPQANDLALLVANKLLTQERADELKTV